MAIKHPAKQKRPAKKKSPGRAAKAVKGANPARQVPIRARPLKRPLPAKSVAKAAKAFKNFSLSKFAKAAPPANFVPAAQAKNPAAVQQVQRKNMVQSLAAAQRAVSVNPGMSLSMPTKMIGNLLPSLAKGAVKLSEVVSLLKSRMPGTEFYADGNPTLSRLATQSQLSTQVQSIIDAIKAGTLK
jgi:hypothetical protein